MRESERKRVEEDIKEASEEGFTLMSVEPTDPHFKCWECGAIVEDWKLHKDWHRKGALFGGTI